MYVARCKSRIFFDHLHYISPIFFFKIPHYILFIGGHLKSYCLDIDWSWINPYVV